jgi:subtilase family serine protease
VHMLAPGEAIYSTFMDGGYKLMWGTSMACPMVAGTAALLQAQAMRCAAYTLHPMPLRQSQMPNASQTED